MMARLNTFAEVILNQIAELPEPQNYDEILVHVESQMALEKLKACLNTVISSQEIITRQNTKIFRDLISDRWQAIKNNTDCIYQHRPHTQANCAYFMLAALLAKISHVATYDILMPPLAAMQIQTSREDLSFFKLNEFILADDGAPIEVIKCLDEAAKNKTLQLRRTDYSKTPLTVKEQARIVNHSVYTLRYYQAIACSVNSRKPITSLKERRELIEHLQNGGYEITASYGEEGRRQLAKKIMEKIKNRSELITAMLRFMPPTKWNDFLSELSEEDLRRIVLEGDSWINTLQRASIYTADDSYNRALLFVLTEIYWREREMQCDAFPMASFVESMTPYWMKTKIKKHLGGCQKKEKESGVKLFKRFLVSATPLDQLLSFIKKFGGEAEENALINDVTSNLVCLTEQAKLLSHPEAFLLKKSELQDFSPIKLSK